MPSRSSVLGTCLLLMGACSLINSPEELKSVSEGGGASVNAAGQPGESEAGEPGMTAAGGDGVGGSSMSNGGCGPDCLEGGAPPIGRKCDDSAECGGAAPVCDPAGGECRACASDQECSTLVDAGLPFCVTAGAQQGRCVECNSDAECSGDTPVCGALGRCRACAAHDECASGVCAPAGGCVASDDAVYALAETGVNGSTCGTIDTPCANPAVAASKLSAQRSHLVFVKTSASFTSGGVNLPAVKGLKVIGNGVALKPYDGQSGFRVPAGAEVVFDNVWLEGTRDEEEGGIECNGGAITVQDSVIKNNALGILATDCDVTVAHSLIDHNATPLDYWAAGISASCSSEGCMKRAVFARNRFVDNGVALYLYGQANALIENNLFLRNGADGYTRVIELRPQAVKFAYNTLVQNFNSCTYVGIVACISQCTNIGNISYDNFPGPNGQCYDQVWYGGTLSYSLTEITQPGTTNRTGDPMFVDAENGDFTPGAGSPAIDGGNPDEAPDIDLVGTSRPQGDAPDMGAFEAK